MLEGLFTAENVTALIALTLMEIVLGIDNIVLIAILTGRLPEHQRAKGRVVGLGAALVMRILLLFAISWVVSLDESAAFTFDGLGIPWFDDHEAVNEVTWKDLVLLAGGLFLVGKAVHEIHVKIEGGGEQHKSPTKASFSSVILQVAMIDIVFSLDSVITAVGMAKELWVMVTAVIIAIAIMIIFAKGVSHFVQRHPTLKMLALSFLILIGVMLIAEAIGTHIDKGYIYFAMGFALLVEVLNLQIRRRVLPITEEEIKTAEL